MFLTYRAESAVHHRDAEAVAVDARAALDLAVEAEAKRCIELVTGLIGRLSERNEQPIAELRDYARYRLQQV